MNALKFPIMYTVLQNKMMLMQNKMIFLETLLVTTNQNSLLWLWSVGSQFAENLRWNIAHIPRACLLIVMYWWILETLHVYKLKAMLNWNSRQSPSLYKLCKLLMRMVQAHSWWVASPFSARLIPLASKLHWKCKSSSGMGMCLTGNGMSLLIGSVHLKYTFSLRLPLNPSLKDW